MASVRGKDLISAAIAQVATPGTASIVADADVGARSRVYVTAISVSLAAAGTIKFTSGGGDITGAQNFAANGGMTLVGDIDNPVLVGALDGGLQLVSAGAGAGANGWVTYYVLQER